MKSIKELEQEIEEYNKNYNQKEVIDFLTFIAETIGKENYYKLENHSEQGHKNATLNQTIAIKEMIEESPNPYPIDIFLEIDERIIPLINKWLKKELGFPLDRLSAHIGRKVRKNLQEELLSKVNGNIKSLT